MYESVKIIPFQYIYAYSSWVFPGIITIYILLPRMFKFDQCCFLGDSGIFPMFFFCQIIPFYRVGRILSKFLKNRNNITIKEKKEDIMETHCKKVSRARECWVINCFWKFITSWFLLFRLLFSPFSILYSLKSSHSIQPKLN